MGEPRTFGMDFGLSSNPAKDDPQGKARRGYSRRHIAFACLALVALCLFIRRSTAGAVGNDDARSRGDVAFSDLMHPKTWNTYPNQFKSDDQITPHRPPQEVAAAAEAEHVPKTGMQSTPTRTPTWNTYAELHAYPTKAGKEAAGLGTMAAVSKHEKEAAAAAAAVAKAEKAAAAAAAKAAYSSTSLQRAASSACCLADAACCSITKTQRKAAAAMAAVAKNEKGAAAVAKAEKTAASAVSQIAKNEKEAAAAVAKALKTAAAKALKTAAAAAAAAAQAEKTAAAAVAQIAKNEKKAAAAAAKVEKRAAAAIAEATAKHEQKTATAATPVCCRKNN